jgi:toxin-antitoxin system PIN domain toxin
LILLDVNVALAAHRADHVHHDVIRPWFDELMAGDEQFGLPDVVVASFVRIATNGRIFKTPSTVEAAFAFARAVRSHPNCVVVAPGEDHLSIFEDICRRFDAAGDMVPDAFIAALGIENDCSLASLDRDFARFDDLDWVVPGADV